MFLNFWKMFLRFFRTLRIYFVIWHNFFCASGFEWIYYTHNGLRAPSWLAILKNHGFVFVQKMYSLYNAKLRRPRFWYSKGEPFWCAHGALWTFFRFHFPCSHPYVQYTFIFLIKYLWLKTEGRFVVWSVYFRIHSIRITILMGSAFDFFFQFSFLTAPVKEALWLSKQSLEVIRINWRSLLMEVHKVCYILWHTHEVT